MNHLRVKRTATRYGAATVELACVLPVFLIFMFGIWTYGHAQMVSNMLKGAARTTARYGATEGVSSAQATARLKQVMAGAVNPAFVTVVIKDASAYDTGGSFPSTASAMAGLPNLELNNCTSRKLFVVRATVNYNSVAIMPGSWFDTVQLSGQSFMRHE